MPPGLTRARNVAQPHLSPPAERTPHVLTALKRVHAAVLPSDTLCPSATASRYAMSLRLHVGILPSSAPPMDTPRMRQIGHCRAAPRRR